MNGVVGGCFPDEMAPDEMALHDGMDGIARSLQAGAVILRWLY